MRGRPIVTSARRGSPSATDDSACGRSFRTTFGPFVRSIVGTIAVRSILGSFAVRERLFGAACREHLRDGDVDQLVHSDSLCLDRKSTRLNSSHLGISYAVFCLKKKKKKTTK